MATRKEQSGKKTPGRPGQPASGRPSVSGPGRTASGRSSASGKKSDAAPPRKGKRARAAEEVVEAQPVEMAPAEESEAEAGEGDPVEVEGELEVEGDDEDLDLGDVAIPEDIKRKTLPVPSGSRYPEALTALNVYLARLKTVQILPIETQAMLAADYQKTGNKDAAARLVASNLRLVVKIAFQFRRQWADVMDLIAEGNLGLAEAIRKFDATRGIPFPSYARFWIRARILAFIQENKHLIHAGSRAARKLFWRLERERRQLIAEGSSPEPALLAERVGVREEDIRELAPILDQRPVSMDSPMHGDEDGRTRGEAMSDPSALDPESEVGGEEIQETLRKVFAEYRDTLDERERAIWDLRLQSEEPVRLEDLGDQFGVSKERVRQLEVRIKARLKDFVQKRLGSDVIIEALH